MDVKKWGIDYDTVLEDFLSEPESLKHCFNQYFSDEGRDFFSKILSSFKDLNVDRVLFIGNTFNHLACYVPHYCMCSSDVNMPFTWQLYELNEFYNYFLPQDFSSELQIKTLYIFISNSGRSKLLMKSIDQLRLLKIDPKFIWLVSNNPKPPVLEYIGFLFQTYVKKEVVLGTKSYIATILVLYLICQVLQLKNPINEENNSSIINLFTDLTDYINRWKKTTNDIMKFIGMDFSFMYLISHEPASYSAAALGALSGMSFSRVLTESISLGLFFHGPFQIINDDYICVVLIGDKLNEESTVLLKRLITQISEKLVAGKILLISNDTEITRIMENNKQIFTVNFECNIEALSPIFELTILQYVFLEIAKRKNLLG